MMNLPCQQTPGAGESGFGIPPPQLLSGVNSDFYNFYSRANSLTLSPVNVAQNLYSAASATTSFPHFGAQPSASSYANEVTQHRTIGSLRPVHTYSVSNEMMPSPIPLTAGDVAMENKFSTQYTGQGDVSRDNVVGVIIGVVCLIILIIVVIFSRKLAQVCSPYPLQTLYPPKKNAAPNHYEMPIINAYGMDLALAIKECYLERERLIVGELIASGNFGEVRKGELRNRDGTVEKVAVKSLLTLDGRDGIKKFLREGVMTRGLNHQHVLSLIGVCFEDDYLRKSPLIVLPFMENGDLRTFLLRDRNNALTVMNLLNFCGHVARGMKYLAGKKFVHRDLAARNCMVDEKWCVKVADFGLSRDLFDRDYYSSSVKTQLPLKWMPPESIKYGRYDEKTDVWSYGIVCWEIMTHGAIPYPTVPAVDILQYLSYGNRMEKPECCPSKLYSVMKSCWSDEPTERPTFSKLVEITAALEKSYLRPGHGHYHGSFGFGGI